MEENLTLRYLEKQGCKGLDIQELKKELKKIYEKAKEKNIKYSKYYALIKFDGDSMGEWLSGKNLKDKSKLENFHKALSEKLREFAKYSESYLNDKKGKTVYAGGDDFLGFITLGYLFEVMKNLREEFDKKVNQPLKEKFPLEKDLTFSAGVVIAHYKDPLSLVLDWVNKLEEEAKNLDERKNAFGIAVLKRSGEIRKAVFKWENIENITYIYKQLQEDSNKETKFNISFVSKLEESLKKLPVSDKECIQKGGDLLIESELKRVLARSSNLEKQQKQKEIKAFKEKSEILIRENPKNFLELLNIKRFILREMA